MKRSSEPSTARCSIAGLVLAAVAADVAQPKRPGIAMSIWIVDERPGAAEHVVEVELDLRAVEGGLARLDRALEAGALDGRRSAPARRASQSAGSPRKRSGRVETETCTPERPETR